MRRRSRNGAVGPLALGFPDEIEFGRLANQASRLF